MSQFSKGLSERRLAFIDRNKELWLCPIVPPPTGSTGGKGKSAVAAKHKLHTQVGPGFQQIRGGRLHSLGPPARSPLNQGSSHDARELGCETEQKGCKHWGGAGGKGFQLQWALNPTLSPSTIVPLSRVNECRWKVLLGTTRAMCSPPSPTGGSSRGTTPTPWRSTVTCWGWPRRLGMRRSSAR